MWQRESIDSEGFSHENPIPVASRIGPYLATGALTGKDPETGEMPSDLDTQVKNVFDHIHRVMAAAGGTPEDILKITVYLAEYRQRSALNAAWLEMFPDPSSRPARHVIAASLDRGALIQADLFAILQDS
ncbi:MAG TPA: RidA family protein [Enteractinococcus sp.]